MEILTNFLFVGLFLALLLVVWYFFYGRAGSGGGNTASMPVLNRYGRDLTKAAKEGKLDPVVGRSEEISRVIQVLSRRTKNNPVLIGRAGIGKTAIVEGLALSIAKRQVPPVLFTKRVLALDLAGTLAGTKYRGEFEQRLKKITDEIAAARRMIILFIDEIHILAAAGEAEGALNAADILKPMLSRGELQVVGATTREEYEQYIKKDKTLDRRLQPIFVSEPTPKQTEAILKGVKNVYEDYHQVTISEAAIKEAISATKNIKNRAYPDKAIDAIDEASSKVSLERASGKKKGKRLEVGPEDIREVVAEWRKNSYN
ncbi:MAG: AAA family ATPase [Patescibacteria group bacterium]